MDDIVLFLQGVIDRLVRRLRRGAASERTHRRLLIVQIDGLSRAGLRRGPAARCMPPPNRALRPHGFGPAPVTGGAPPPTPAFPTGAVYGVRPEIPCLRCLDR